MDLFTRVYFPMLATILYLLILKYPEKAVAVMNAITQFIAGLAGRKRKGHVQVELWEGIVRGLRPAIGDWRKTVLIPVVLALAVDVAVSAWFQAQLHSYGEPAAFAIVFSGILSPIAEEFLVRGFVLGAIISISSILFAKNLRIINPIVYMFGLLLTSYVFTISHVNTSNFQFFFRFFSSILFGALYIANGRNLLPSIVAHSASNMLIILMDWNQGPNSSL